jgi:hypothetical protein
LEVIWKGDFGAQGRIFLPKLSDLHHIAIPILPALLSSDGHCAAFPFASDADARRIGESIAAQYGLNADQRTALCLVAHFFESVAGPPVLVVHGIFGAGTSQLPSVITIFLHEIRNAHGEPWQVLFSASTNIAVDNLDFHNFTRVGSVRKIRRSLVPYVTGHGAEEALSELTFIISEADKAERPALQEAVKNARTEMDSRQTRLDAAWVVGVTCAATAFPVLAEGTFAFALLDKCSQQTEPVSLLSVTFGRARLVCCGEPLQLPPALARDASRGYGRPLFSRRAPFFPPLMLE